MRMALSIHLLPMPGHSPIAQAVVPAVAPSACYVCPISNYVCENMPSAFSQACCMYGNLPNRFSRFIAPNLLCYVPCTYALSLLAFLPSFCMYIVAVCSSLLCMCVHAPAALTQLAPLPCLQAEEPFNNSTCSIWFFNILLISSLPGWPAGSSVQVGSCCWQPATP